MISSSPTRRPAHDSPLADRRSTHAHDVLTGCRSVKPRTFGSCAIVFLRPVVARADMLCAAQDVGGSCRFKGFLWKTGKAGTKGAFKRSVMLPSVPRQSEDTHEHALRLSLC